jgi:hypothetical protein
MQSTLAPAANHLSLPRLGSRLVSLLLHPLSLIRRAQPDPARVAFVTSVVSSEPVLRQWLLIIASEPARVRHALLARATQEMRVTLCSPEVAEVMEQLADEPLLRAVTKSLFRRSGMEPPAQETGRAARVRLTELSERLQKQESSFVA